MMVLTKDKLYCGDDNRYRIYILYNLYDMWHADLKAPVKATMPAPQLKAALFCNICVW